MTTFNSTFKVLPSLCFSPMDNVFLAKKQEPGLVLYYSKLHFINNFNVTIKILNSVVRYIHEFRQFPLYIQFKGNALPLQVKFEKTFHNNKKNFIMT